MHHRINIFDSFYRETFIAYTLTTYFAFIKPDISKRKRLPYQVLKAFLCQLLLLLARLPRSVGDTAQHYAIALALRRALKICIRVTGVVT